MRQLTAALPVLVGFLRHPQLSADRHVTLCQAASDHQWIADCRMGRFNACYRRFELRAIRPFERDGIADLQSQMVVTAYSWHNGHRASTTQFKHVLYGRKMYE